MKRDVRSLGSLDKFGPMTIPCFDQIVLIHSLVVTFRLGTIRRRGCRTISFNSKLRSIEACRRGSHGTNRCTGAAGFGVPEAIPVHRGPVNGTLSAIPCVAEWNSL